MSRSNRTRALMLEAFDAAKIHAEKASARLDPARSVLAFLSGYCRVEEPELVRKIDEVLESCRKADAQRSAP